MSIIYSVTDKYGELYVGVEKSEAVSIYLRKAQIGSAINIWENGRKVRSFTSYDEFKKYDDNLTSKELIKPKRRGPKTTPVIVTTLSTSRKPDIKRVMSSVVNHRKNIQLNSK